MIVSALVMAELALAVAGLVGLLGHRHRIANTIVYGLATVAAGAATVSAASFLIAPSPAEAPTLILPVGLPWLLAHFRLDALGAYFLLLVDGVATVVSLYAIAYGRHEPEPARVLPIYPLFLAAMNLVLVADDAFAFLFSWELMSVVSWLLVLATHKEAETPRAAYVYLIMAGIGTALLLVGYGLLAGAQGDYTFTGIRQGHYAPWLLALAALLLLLGAGSKAGLFPLHAWLPLAHPAAPSHVSALMSGAMTKVALYAVLRALFDLAPASGAWLGAALLILGGASAVMGTLYALFERDFKKLLAYSTVENIGVIAIAFGLALLFRTYGMTAAATLALAAGLFHALNHALLKCLLFCGAGAVASATGLRDIEFLGGLIRRLPATAFLVLIGASGLSALPPLNGFASEWLLFQAVLAGADLPPWEFKFAVAVIGALLALAAALAAALFIRAYGVAFLGRPRSSAAAQAGEVELPMRLAMALFAVASVAFGLLPSLALAFVDPVALALTGMPTAAAPGQWLWLQALPGSVSTYSGLVMLLAIAAIATAVMVLAHRLGTDRVRRGPAWDCGYPDPRPATQYSASSFAQPLRRVFGTTLFHARERVEMPEPGDPAPARFTVSLSDLAWNRLYAPVADFIAFTTERANALQFLTIRRYLSLMFLALALLLVVVAVTQ
jgi:formate hydrogenlyase subunit 3/multisubunit Na+/H+ antiporter MnhD subunit